MKIPVQPMEPILRPEPFDKEDFLYQVKWDGIRCLSLWDKGKLLHLWGKKGQEMTSHYPHLKIDAKTPFSLLLDGEIVLLNPEGKPSFPRLMQYHLHRIKKIPPGYALGYMVFDLLLWNNKWTLTKPLTERQKLLEEMITPSEGVQIVPSFSEGILLYRITGEHKLEGIVAKRKTSLYHGGKSHQDWFKIKHQILQPCIIGGILWKEEGKEEIRSLLVGAYYQDQLFYIGSVATGLSHKDRLLLKEGTKKWMRIDSPFIQGPGVRMPVTWLNPKIALQVEFMEWSPDKKMRVPRIKGFLSIDPATCTLDEAPF